MVRSRCTSSMIYVLILDHLGLGHGEHCTSRSLNLRRFRHVLPLLLHPSKELGIHAHLMLSTFAGLHLEKLRLADSSLVATAYDGLVLTLVVGTKLVPHLQPCLRLCLCLRQGRIGGLAVAPMPATKGKPVGVLGGEDVVGRVQMKPPEGDNVIVFARKSLRQWDREFGWITRGTAIGKEGSSCIGLDDSAVPVPFLVRIGLDR